MASKQFDSILGSAPAATIKNEKQVYSQNLQKRQEEEFVAIVAKVPLSLKEEIHTYVKNHKGETVSGLILKGLIKLGFEIDESLTVDKRQLR